jgi:hypothetical protein
MAIVIFAESTIARDRHLMRTHVCNVAVFGDVSGREDYSAFSDGFDVAGSGAH